MPTTTRQLRSVVLRAMFTDWKAFWPKKARNKPYLRGEPKKRQLSWHQPTRWSNALDSHPRIRPGCGGMPCPNQHGSSSVLERIGQTIRGDKRGCSSIFVFVSTDFRCADVLIPFCFTMVLLMTGQSRVHYQTTKQIFVTFLSQFFSPLHPLRVCIGVNHGGWGMHPPKKIILPSPIRMVNRTADKTAACVVLRKRDMYAFSSFPR